MVGSPPPQAWKLPTPSQFFWLLDEVWAISQMMRTIMTQNEQLQGGLDSLTTAVTGMRTAVDLQLQQQRDVLAELSTRNPPTQAQLDQLNASVTAIGNATAALGADDTSVTPNA